MKKHTVKTAPISKVDLSGEKFGRLLVVGKSLLKHPKHAYWDCVCDCGVKKTATRSHLLAGDTKSCGCLAKEVASSLCKQGIRKTHGKAGSRVYRIWSLMLQRCGNKNNLAFPLYGGRGITVCQKWHSFESFYLDMGEPPKGTEIDRKNNSKGYNKENCHWVYRKTNCQNRRSTRHSMRKAFSIRFERRMFGASTTELSHRYGTSKSTTEKIIYRIQWV